MDWKYFMSAEDLEKKLANKPENFALLDVTRGKGNYPLAETRTERDYEAGHIPGAQNFSTDELGEFKAYLKPYPDLVNTFLVHGVGAKTELVVYSIYAEDIMYIASRVAWAAYVVGVENVKILNGGFQAWERAGFALESGVNVATPKSNFKGEYPKHPDCHVKTPDDLKAALEGKPNVKLACVRSLEEFEGKTQGHAWNAGAGQIKGAIYMGDDEVLMDEQGLLADPKTYLEAFEAAGFTKDQRIIVYCGTSWRASTAFFVLKSLGYPEVAVFDGSWYKWKIAHDAEPEQYPVQ